MTETLKHCLEGALSVPVSLLRAFRRYPPLSSLLPVSSPKILLVASHWIGDTFWAAQVVPFLRELWPDVFLCCVTKPFCAPLWSGVMAVDEIVESRLVISDRRRETVNWSALYAFSLALRPRKWDLVIDLTGNRYSAAFSHWLYARHTLGFGGGELKSLYATRVANAERPGQHLAERPWRVVEALTGKFSYPKSLIPPIPKESYASLCRRYRIPEQCPVAVISPGAGWPEKEWGEENYTRLARELMAKGYAITLIDSADRLSRLERIATACAPGKFPPVILSEPGIDSTLSLISGCAQFFGNDSGLGHIAAAMGRATTMIFTDETNPQTSAPIGHQGRAIRAGCFDSILSGIPDAGGI